MPAGVGYSKPQPQQQVQAPQHQSQAKALQGVNTTLPDPYYQGRYKPFENSGLANTFAEIYSQGLGNFGEMPYGDAFYNWLGQSGVQNMNETLQRYYDSGGEFHPGLFQELGVGANLPFSDQVGAQGDALGYGPGFISPQQAAQQGFGFGIQQPQPQQDPFLAFLLNQLGIAGLGQQSQPQRERARSPLVGGPGPQPQQSQPSLYGNTVNQLSGADSLLAQLLGGL